jgi:O-antigen/teichoic acid export membrane protein
VDLLLIGRYFDSVTVTTYALTKRPVDMLVSLFQRPLVALSPTISFLVGGGDKTDLAKFVAKSSIRIMWLLGPVVVGTAFLLEPVIELWVGAGHFLGSESASLLVAGLGVSILTSLFSSLYWASGETVGFYRINTLLSVLIFSGIVVGINWFGVGGLLLGALLPRVVFTIWIFPSLAFRALEVSDEGRKNIGHELGWAALAVLVGLASGWFLRRGAAPSAWLQASVALFFYLTALSLCSRRFRQDARALAARAWRECRSA